MHRNILKHPKFKKGNYTTQFVDKHLGPNKEDFFGFVEDDVFLITAAIEAYKQNKNRDVSNYALASSWKERARIESLRK